jgi:hypothetical protein
MITELTAKSMADRPVLAVIPLPAPVATMCTVILALADLWEREYGQTLTNAHMTTETTPWGEALVVREPARPEPEETP